MRNIIFIYFLAIFSIFGQDGFKYNSKKRKIVVPIKIIDNLIFVPINVNGVELNLLLDTGVEETILFSLEEQEEEVSFKNVETIKLKGLGKADYIEALKSTNNPLKINNSFIDNNHELYIILDQKFNISSHIGIPVNGIIGYKFFKNSIVEINYIKKKLIIHRDYSKIQKKLIKRYSKIEISIEKNKPYITTKLSLNNNEIKAKLLLDIGNADAIWLFDANNNNIEIPENNFDDYLGRGFSGEIYGKRAKLDVLKFNEYEFKNLYVAFPDSVSVQSAKMVKNRVGSVGAEITRRFSIFIDYTKEIIYLKKNLNYYNPFNFNMSGLDFQHDGLQWVQEMVYLQTKKSQASGYGGIEISLNPYKYKFELKPKYSIFNVRKGSPAALSGIKKGDILLTINGKKAYYFTLQEISALLKSEENKQIVLEIERNSQVYKFSFFLKNII